jgi:hypothetical protein
MNGQSGTAHLGFSTYVSLSHPPKRQKDSKKAGSCMLALLLINDATDHRKTYVSYNCGSDLDVNNVICVHEANVLLHIGLAEAI